MSLAPEEQDGPVEQIESLPGAMLRAAREARGLPVSDIAHALKFSERQISALEEDRYDDLPGGQFVRGFIRSYARLVKLDPSPLIATLNQTIPASSVEVLAPQNMGDAGPRPPLFNRQRTFFAGSLFFVVLGVMAYLGTESLEPAKEGAPGKSEIVSVVQPVTAVSAVQVPPNLVPQLAPTSSSGRRLVFDFDGTSWLEVRDANNAVILTGEFPRGTHHELAGAAPFQIWVGNAPVVRAALDGHSLDFQPYTREGIARMTAN